MRAGLILVLAALAAAPGFAAEFKTTLEQPTTLYDGPSSRARALFLYGRDVPVEVIVVLEGWVKVRDVAGTIGWMDRKALGDRRMLVVRVATADVRAAADESAPIVFRAEHGVLLELNEAASSPATTTVPGWVRVRHRDGQGGYVRLAQVFGL